MLKVLFVAANPKTSDGPRIEEEARLVREDPRMAEHRSGVAIVPLFAPRPDDLLQGILREEPQVLHLAGHGGALGFSCIGDDGEEKPYKGPLIRSVTRQRGYVHVVIMNACHTPLAAKILLETVVAVISMKAEATDKLSLAFTSAFYRSIRAGKAVQDAFDDGVASMLNEGASPEDKAVFQAKDGVNPRKFSFG